MNWDLTNWKSILLNFLRGESGDELSWRYPYLKGIKGMIQILVRIDKLSNVGSALDKMPIKSTRIGSHPLEKQKQKQIVWSCPFLSLGRTRRKNKTNSWCEKGFCQILWTTIIMTPSFDNKLISFSVYKPFILRPTIKLQWINRTIGHMIPSHAATDIIISGHDFSSFQCSQHSNITCSFLAHIFIFLKFNPTFTPIPELPFWSQSSMTRFRVLVSFPTED